MTLNSIISVNYDYIMTGSEAADINIYSVLTLTCYIKHTDARQ